MMRACTTVLTAIVLLAGYGGVTNAKANGNGGVGQAANCPLNQLTTDIYSLTDVQKGDLLFMWEEEKLARDVYEYLNSRYGSRVFANISLSEQRHMDAVARLLTKYEIQGEINGEVRGEFSIPEIQTMYLELIEKGEQSLYAAFEVGRAVEMADIDDLSDRISRAQPDAKLIYSNLLKGSNRHLAAFNRQLSRF